LKETSKIFLLSPNNNSVFGGIKIINLHASLLSSDYNVFIAEPNKQINKWLHKPYCNIVSYKDVILDSNENDIVLCYWNDKLTIETAFNSKAERKYFLSLNTQPRFRYKKIENIGEEVYNLNWTNILCTSDYLKSNIEEHSKNTSLITIGVDTSIFYKKDKIKNTAAYFDRRGSFVDKNIDFLKSIGLKLLPIKNKTEVEVSEILGKAEYFLSITEGLFPTEITNRKKVEGWNMPAQEAMACGCKVIGYTAGAAPFMTNETSWVVEDYIEEEFKQKIREAINSNETKTVKAINVINTSYSLTNMIDTLLKGIE